MTSLSLETDVPEKKIVNDLMGGLAIAPFGLILLISAYGLAQGWLNWTAHGSIPFLGEVVAWLLYRMILWIYRKKYGFIFRNEMPKKDRKLASPVQFLLFLIFLALLFAFWYVDYRIRLPILFLPLLLALCAIIRGIIWIQKGASLYGQLNLLFGAILLGPSLAPWSLHLSTQNKFFGPEGIFELLSVGTIIILVSLVEHIILLRARTAGLK
jgi:hypothetical protein